MAKTNVPTLRTGSTGNDVKNLQVALQAAGYDVGKSGADGVYGSNTAAAVKQYQQDHGLAVDGIAGKNTMASLASNGYTAVSTGGTKPNLPSLPVAGSQTAAGAAAPKKEIVEAVNLDGGKAPAVTYGPVTGAQIAAGAKPPIIGTKAEKAPGKTKQPTQPPTNTKPTGTAGSSSGSGSKAPASTQQPAVTQDFTYDPFTYQDFTYDPFTYHDFSYGGYVQSDAVKQANALLQQHAASKPGAYQSQWQDEIDDYMSRIENRDPFSYDFNSDALYHQYKDNYIQQGRMAMMDTMGQAAAMTGGYGNSYAQTVGQQAYNQQLSQLNNVIPELYQMAFDRYAYEGQQLQDMYNMYMGREAQDYGRYQDNLNNWYTELNYLTNRYDTESANDYNRYLDGYNQAWNQYITGYDHAWKEYSSGKEDAWNEYSADKKLAYDEYNVGRDKAWDEYVMQQEKDMAAAELMAGAGNYDRLGDVYGLSDSEIAAIEEANKPKATGGTGGKTGPNYKAPTDEQLKNYLNAAGAYGNTPELAQAYSYMYGVDPNFLSGYYNQFVGGRDDQQIDTTVAVTSRNGLPTAEELQKQRQAENRGKNKYMTLY